MSNPWKRSLETVVALAVIALLFFTLWVRVISVVEEPRPAPPMDLGAVPVTLRDLAAEPIELTLDLRGTLAPVRRAAVAVETPGRLVEVAPGWRAGRAVEAGELLARVDALPAELAWETARAARDQATALRDAAEVDAAQAAEALPILEEALAVAGRERARVEELAVTGEASDALVDQALGAELAARSAAQSGRAAVARTAAAALAAEASLAAAEASLRQAADRKGRHDVTAPFAGVLSATGPEVGDLAASGMPLGEVLDTSTLVLLAQVHESDLAGLAPGLDVAVTLPSRPGLELAGTIARLAPAADPLTRSLAVEVELDNTATALPAGLYAEGRVVQGRLDDALWIDRAELRWEAGLPLAFVATGVGAPPGGLVAEPRALTLGPPHGEGFLVTAGLAGGERLIVEPLDRMEVDPSAPTEVRPRAATRPAAEAPE